MNMSPSLLVSMACFKADSCASLTKEDKSAPENPSQWSDWAISLN
jgi:hypothetical protein